MTLTRFWAPLAAALALAAGPALAAEMDDDLRAQMTDLGYAVEELGDLTEAQIDSLTALFEAEHEEDELRTAIDAVLDGEEAEDDA